MRNLSEDVLDGLRTAGATASLVRINPELPLADRGENQPHTFSLLSKGLEAVRAIDAALRRQRAAAAVARGQRDRGEGHEMGEAISTTPPSLQTVAKAAEHSSVPAHLVSSGTPRAGDSVVVAAEGGDGDALGGGEGDVFERFDAMRGKLTQAMNDAILRFGVESDDDTRR